MEKQIKEDKYIYDSEGVKLVYGNEWVKLNVTINMVCGGSAMTYEVVNQSTTGLSGKFKKVLKEDWDIDID